MSRDSFARFLAGASALAAIAAAVAAWQSYLLVVNTTRPVAAIWAESEEVTDVRSTHRVQISNSGGRPAAIHRLVHRIDRRDKPGVAQDEPARVEILFPGEAVPLVGFSWTGGTPKEYDTFHHFCVEYSEMDGKKSAWSSLTSYGNSPPRIQTKLGTLQPAFGGLMLLSRMDAENETCESLLSNERLPPRRPGSLDQSASHRRPGWRQLNERLRAGLVRTGDGLGLPRRDVVVRFWHHDYAGARSTL